MCIIKTVGDVPTRFCLKQEEEEKIDFFCKTRSLCDRHRDLITPSHDLRESYVGKWTATDRSRWFLRRFSLYAVV